MAPDHRAPFPLYVRRRDRKKAYDEMTQMMYKYIARLLIEEDWKDVIHDQVIQIMDSLFRHSRFGTGTALREFASSIVSKAAHDPRVLLSLRRVTKNDYSTLIHTLHVMAFTLRFCFYKGFTKDYTEYMALVALLHDVGKADVPEHILRLDDSLTDREYDQMRKHPEIGAKILEEIGLEEAVNVALMHHEKLDGSGYPHGLKGDEIPYEARVIAVIDIYDSLTSTERVYREPLEPHEALSIIADEARDGKLDSDVVHDFLLCLARDVPVR
jgi:putative nucleotidyltransferase with HDIG domain